ncbi:MAG: 23S rRNA (adenine(2503)-C(2))-methyltransferase RlmN [Desulfocapsaceae bacterium]|jgi:23S rRNA (adenine2503-C2)-methyltransferase|nr:23S rRNA (adenine(2503)-C(2))-methyltransferase RlmN [Desulfocapsaceae bacterium]
MKTDCRNLDQRGLIAFVEALGQPPFRGRQIMSWLYRSGISDFSEMTDLAKSFRGVLAEHAFISSFSSPIVERSGDGCLKFGFSLEDGNIIESVLIPETDRNTLCISSQVGCAMNCRFCKTGTMGFVRNLTPAEIVNQVCYVRDFLQTEQNSSPGSPTGITNLVFMGMGEPLNNMDNLLVSLAILTEQKGLDLAARRITVSTCGIIDNISRLGQNSNVNLAISLHAVDNETRTQLMPINRKYPLEHLLQACRDYPIQKRKRIMFEYVLLDGVNDSDAEAEQCARMLRGIPCKINLLAFNEVENIPYRPSSRERILAFQDILRHHNYSVFVRSSRGSDISAACGQLAGKSQPADKSS